jgi:A/G-specific adenine glycosylase
VGELPVKQNKTKQRDRYFNYLVFEFANNTWLRQRIKNDIWRGLFEFPVIETSEETEVVSVLNHPGLVELVASRTTSVKLISNWKIHLLSHQRIHYRFIWLELSEEIKMTEGLVKVNKEDILNFAVPRLIEECINDLSQK